MLSIGCLGVDLFAQNLAGGSYDGGNMAQVSPCAATVYTNIYIGGSYDGDNMAQVSPCAATVYTNIFTGGSYDGENMAQVSPCAPTVYTNIYTGGSYDGENMVQVSPCAPTVYTNLFKGGTCGGSFVSVTTCTGETWTYPTCATIPLPVELLSFTASLTDKETVLLEWTTSTEINNDYFAIEKTKDGIHYEEIGRINGAGNSNKNEYYSMLDESPYPGQSYYRLRQVDFNGAFTYSPIREIYIGTLEIISIYPNPSTDGSIQYIVTSEAGGELTVKVYDVLGREALSKTETLQGGVTTTKKLSTATLSSGSYLLWIINGNLEKTQKQFVIE
ncbi:MAG: T9SS type A sorting domain-containing protein [Bacteroidetes bacterium]|nr:T9SS type A sorting domain-containing protein [Bacteroidota bacterium]